VEEPGLVPKPEASAFFDRVECSIDGRGQPDSRMATAAMTWNPEARVGRLILGGWARPRQRHLFEEILG
jgi:hypothetical protein